MSFLSKRRAARLQKALDEKKLVIQKTKKERAALIAENGAVHVYPDGSLSAFAALLSSRELRKLKTRRFNGSGPICFLTQENTLTTLDDLRVDDFQLDNLDARETCVLDLNCNAGTLLKELRELAK